MKEIKSARQREADVKAAVAVPVWYCKSDCCGCSPRRVVEQGVVAMELLLDQKREKWFGCVRESQRKKEREKAYDMV